MGGGGLWLQQRARMTVIPWYSSPRLLHENRHVAPFLLLLLLLLFSRGLPRRHPRLFMLLSMRRGQSWSLGPSRDVLEVQRKVTECYQAISGINMAHSTLIQQPGRTACKARHDDAESSEGSRVGFFFWVCVFLISCIYYEWYIKMCIYWCVFCFVFLLKVCIEYID